MLQPQQTPGSSPPTRPSWLANEAVIAARLLTIGVTVVAGLWVLVRLEMVVAAGFISLALTALLWPLAARLRRWLPAVVAALVCVTGLLGLLGQQFWFIGARVSNSWTQIGDAVAGGLRHLDEWATSSGLTAQGDLLDNAFTELQNQIGTWGQAAVTGLSALGSFSTVVVITVFLTIFALVSGEKLVESSLSVTPAPGRPPLENAFRRAFTAARWWLAASTVTGLVDGVLIGAGMWLLGLPLAVPVGALTFILGFIPMVGATLAGAVAVLIGLFFSGPTTALWVLLIVLAVQQIEGNVLSPVLMSRAMKFHPIVTLLLTTAGGLLFGLTGLFLAVPLTGIITAGVKGWKESRREPESVETQGVVPEAG